MTKLIQQYNGFILSKALESFILTVLLQGRANYSRREKSVYSEYIIKIQNDCKLNGEILIEIDPLHKRLNYINGLFNFDNFLQHLKLESGRYASQNGGTFAVSVEEL